MCERVCERVCMFVSMFVCVYVCLCLCLCVRVCVRARVRVCVRVCVVVHVLRRISCNVVLVASRSLRLLLPTLSHVQRVHPAGRELSRRPLRTSGS